MCVLQLCTLGVAGVDSSLGGAAGGGSSHSKVAALADGVLIADCLAQMLVPPPPNPQLSIYSTVCLF